MTIEGNVKRNNSKKNEIMILFLTNKLVYLQKKEITMAENELKEITKDFTIDEIIAAIKFLRDMDNAFYEEIND